MTSYLGIKRRKAWILGLDQEHSRKLCKKKSIIISLVSIALSLYTEIKDLHWK